MHRVTLPSVALVLVSALVAQRGEGRQRGPGPDREPPRLQLANFDFQELEFESKCLTDGKGRFGVFLPKGFADEAAKDRRYPLVVWLHGFGGYQEFQGRGGARLLDEMRGSGALPELVFAVFQGPGSRRNRTVYVNGDASGRVEDAIVQELVACAIERCRAATAPAQHALMGVSIGGFGALKIAMKHPDVFGVVAAHSSAIFADDPEQLPEQYSRQVDRAMQMGLGEVFGQPIDRAKWAAEMPMGLARNAGPDAFASLRIYFDAGTEDRYGFAAPNEALSKLMSEKGIAHTFRLVEGGGHAWSSESMLDNLRHSLAFVGKAVTGQAVDAGKAPAGERPGDAQPGK